jgi:N-acetylglucosaminyl-diphospho-decaprenol L-rhamnosyltransferase
MNQPGTAGPVDVVTVSYNSSHLIGGFLDALEASADELSTVYVVDSGSDDAATTREIVEGRGANFVPLAANVGFGTATNAGVARSSSRWVAVVNPDVKASMATLHRLAEQSLASGAQCIGPEVRDEDGARVRTWRGIIAPPWRRGVGTPAYREGPMIWTDSISGCCMVIDRPWFERLRGFDESFFMFSEEIDLHSRLRSLGGRTAVFLGVSVVTPGGSSSEGVSRRWSMTERSISHVHFVAKHYSRVEAIADVAFRAIEIVVKREFRPSPASIRQFARGVKPFVASRSVR